MADDASRRNHGEELLKVLTAHYRALVSARSDETLLKQYALLLRTLKSKPSWLDVENSTAARPRSRPASNFSEDAIRGASLDDLEKIINDTTTPRKDLEFIAIQRFSVPHGSMRKFADREMLVDKLRTLIGNERAHITIGAVAREQARIRGS